MVSWLGSSEFQRTLRLLGEIQLYGFTAVRRRSMENSEKYGVTFVPLLVTTTINMTPRKYDIHGSNSVNCTSLTLLSRSLSPVYMNLKNERYVTRFICAGSRHVWDFQNLKNVPWNKSKYKIISCLTLSVHIPLATQ
jgi:hypothetical protein